MDVDQTGIGLDVEGPARGAETCYLYGISALSIWFCREGQDREMGVLQIEEGEIMGDQRKGGVQTLSL